MESVIVISLLVFNQGIAPACLLAFWMEQTEASMTHIFHRKRVSSFQGVSVHGSE